MPRPLLQRTDRFAYHVTFRSNNKEWFYIPIEQCWSIFRWCLAKAAARYQAEIHTLVLMSNHVHLILSTHKGNLDCVMQYFLSVATIQIQQIAGRTNHVLGGRYKWNVLSSATALAYAYKYVLRNPIRAGLCAKVEDYPFSSLNDLSSDLPLVERFDRYWALIPRQMPNRLTWLNKATPKEAEDLVRKALRRYEFKFTKSNSHQALLRTLERSYGVTPEL